MKLPATRIQKISSRRSPRLQSRQQHSVSVLHSLETCHEKPPVEAATPKPREQFEGYPCVPQIQTRKRRQDESLDSDLDTDSDVHPKRRRLTERNLKEFERMSQRSRKKSKSLQPRGPSRLGSNSACSEANSGHSKTSEFSTKSVSTTDSSFPRRVFENGVLDPQNSVPPENLDYIQDQLNRPRDAVSPTESEYQDFVYRTQNAPNKQTMLLETSKLLKDYNRGYHRVYNQGLHDFPKDAPFRYGLSAAQPDMIEGLDLLEFEVPMRQELGGAAVPTSEINATTLPHMAGKWKGSGKDMVLAKTQAAYTAAHMVYGRDAARAYLESPDPDGCAYVQSFTTDGTTLYTFTHYSSKSQDEVKFHQYPTSSSFLTSSHQEFVQARRRLRNQQDIAKEAAEQLRDDLNEKWSADQNITSSHKVENIHRPASGPTSTDYDSYDLGFEADPNNQLLSEYLKSLPGQEQS